MRIKLYPFKKICFVFAFSILSSFAFGQTTYTLITSTTDLVAGEKYIVANGKAGTVKLLSFQDSSNRDQTTNSYTVSGTNKITVTAATTNTDKANGYDITLGGSSGSWTLYDAVNTGFLDTNFFGSLEVKTASTNWTIAFGGSGNANINTAALFGFATAVLKYNSSSTLFSCYTSGQSDVYLFKKDKITTYNGVGTTGWTNGIPTITEDAIIAVSYPAASIPTTTFSAKTLTINTGATLNINTTKSVTAKTIINNGAITVNDGGNLLQGVGDTYSGSGTFTVEKSTASASTKYNFWSSPVAAQNMFGIFPTTPQYVMTYNTNTDYFNVLANPATSTFGTGYSIKTPASSTQGTFVGTPNNGASTATLSTAANKYNLVGNPYPSNINLTQFYTLNSANIEPSFYFWDNTTAPTTTQTGAQTSPIGYATFNASGSGTWTSAANGVNVTASAPVATIGQGFIVEAKTTSLQFDNTMRVATAGTFLNKNTNSTNEGKYWLKLKTPYNASNVLAITYGEGAQNTLDAFDSEAIALGDDAFYSTVGTKSLAIQGRNDFATNDVVPLVTKQFEAGNHEIALVNTQGIFANNAQAILLHDKQLGTYTDLQNGSYFFSANAGLTENRFEIVYVQSVLASQNTMQTDLQIYKDGESFVVKSPENISEIKIFDISGRLMQTLNPNAKTSKIKGLAKGIYLLKIQSGKEIITKKIMK